MFKVGAMSYGLAGLVEDEQPTWQHILQVAAELELDGVEFYESHWGGKEEDVENAAAVKGRAAELGLELFAIGSGARLGFDDERRRAAMETLRTQIRAAAAVGAAVVTFPAIDAAPVPAGGDGARGGLDFGLGAGPLVEQVREAAAFATEYGVRLALLNHCFFVSSSWHQEWVVKLAGAENVGICLDPGNYLYYDCEDPLSATRRLAGSVHMVRLGDWARRGEEEVKAEFAQGKRLQLYGAAPFGDGEVDHATCFRLLKESGYEGYLSLKSVGSLPEGPRAAFQRAVQRTRAMVAGL